MAYAAKTYQRNWGYDPHADDFNARVGKILSGGLDLQASMRSKALGELASTRAFEAAEQEAQRTSYVAQHMHDDPGMNARVPDSRKPGSGDAKGFVWVDEKGQYMGHVETTRLPRSTFTDHFGSKSGVLDAEVPDKTHHLKKTDFSEYTEVKLKIMQNLK
eukprot:XP_001697783.1 flagellar associated protein [Chlamydomonas reinhardtii]